MSFFIKENGMAAVMKRIFNRGNPGHFLQFWSMINIEVLFKYSLLHDFSPHFCIIFQNMRLLRGVDF